VSEFLVAVALDLLANLGEHGEQRNRDERKRQHQRDHHVTALGNLQFAICNLVIWRSQTTMPSHKRSLACKITNRNYQLPIGYGLYPGDP
jgi:hypothetical protein